MGLGLDGGRGGFTYVPATVEGALAQNWLRAASGGVRSGVARLRAAAEWVSVARSDRLRSRMMGNKFGYDEEFSVVVERAQ